MYIMYDVSVRIVINLIRIWAQGSIPGTCVFPKVLILIGLVRSRCPNDQVRYYVFFNFRASFDMTDDSDTSLQIYSCLLLQLGALWSVGMNRKDGKTRATATRETEPSSMGARRFWTQFGPVACQIPGVLITYTYWGRNGD